MNSVAWDRNFSETSCNLRTLSAEILIRKLPDSDFETSNFISSAIASAFSIPSALPGNSSTTSLSPIRRACIAMI